MQVLPSWNRDSLLTLTFKNGSIAVDIALKLIRLLLTLGARWNDFHLQLKVWSCGLDATFKVKFTKEVQWQN